MMLSILLLIPLLAVYGSASQSSPNYEYFQKLQSALSWKTASTPFDKPFDKFVDQTLSRWHVPGLAIAVIKDGITYTKGYGIATFPDEHVTPETLFFTGGATKAHTAAAASLLVDDDKDFKNVQWGTPLSSLIPDDFVLRDNASIVVSLEDALSHRSGLPAHTYAEDIEDSTTRDAVRRMRYLPLSAQIRTKFQYSNLMYVAVSHALEVVTGLAIGDFLRTRLWEPLGMMNTFLSVEDAQTAQSERQVRLAHGYKWDELLGFQELSYASPPHLSGAIGLISNVVDYSKWIGMMMNSTLPISEKGHAALTTPRSILYSPGTGHDITPMAGSEMYALGWYIHHYHGNEIIFHAGNHQGFGALVGYLPRQKFGFAVMANSAQTIAPASLALRLVENFLDTPKAKRFDWNNGFEKAAQRYEDWMKQRLKHFHSQTPNPPVPPTLPLSSYTGTYHHPAYQNITVSLCNGTLVADFLNRTLPFRLTLTHTNKDVFVVQDKPSDTSKLAWVSIGAFVIASLPDHIPLRVSYPSRFGIRLEDSVGIGGQWFEFVNSATGNC